MLIFINYVCILLGINLFCPEGPTCYVSPVTCHQSHVTCWPLFNTLIVLPNISIQHIVSVTLPTAMWILPMCFLILKLNHCLVAQKNPKKKTLMFPWLPDINLFNFYSGSHGKLLNTVVFFHVLVLDLLLTHIHPLSFLLSHLQVLGLLLVLHHGALFLRKSGGTKEVDD